MRRTEFAKLRRAIEAEELRIDDSDPINYGLQRAIFETERLKKLIAAAEQFDMQSTRRKAAQWRRRLAKSLDAQQRFETLKLEADAKKNPTPPPITIPAGVLEERGQPAGTLA